MTGLRVAILGGGMAGLTAAWELSRPEHRDRVAQVTVYQRGWRLGGKGASSRGIHGRIEEHGLHVWLGYYDNAFRVIREVYDELDRPRTDPACPIVTWRDAFAPAEHVGAAEPCLGSARWSPWVASFARNGLEPGDPDGPGAGGPAGPPGPVDAARLAGRAATLLRDLWASLGPAARPPVGVFLTGSPRPPGPPGGARGPLRSFTEVGDAVRRAEMAALAGALRAVELMQRSAPVELWAPVLDRLGGLLDTARARVLDDDAGRRLWQFSDLLVTCVRGMVADGLVAGPHRYPAIDDLDFRAWLASHGADPATLHSPIVSALYDLVFAYEDGDPDRPAFAAGLGLFLATKLFFEYRGAVFWKMRAGMGDVVFAPLYQALRARGVEVEFFVDVQAVRVEGDPEDGTGRLAAIEVARQAQPVAGRGGYDPLVTVRGLPCFPAVPDTGQLAGAPPAEALAGAERRPPGGPAGEPDVLVAGRDVDVVILATSLGMVPYVCGDLVGRPGRWRDMVDNVATVATQAAQLWVTRSERELGWDHPNATLSGWAKPFDTYASMSHLLPMEDWPAGDEPRGLAYLCSALAEPEAADAGGDGHEAEERVRASLARLLDERMGDLWPEAVGRDGFRWDVLHGGLGGQFVTAATDPSDRYVQSLPGTDRHRLRVDESGVDGLVLAGDWTNCGLNAGCIEAAVLSGLQAANAVLGRDLLDGVLGSWYPMGRAAATAGGGVRA